jgi:homoserine O-succinyltransferase
MPLVAYKNIPSFTRLQKDGHLILSEDRALRQDYRGLHIGFLNMMPDAALEITERQFFRLIGRSDRIVQFYMHPFTISGIERGDEAQKYIHDYYETFDDIKAQGLDALIISGANISTCELADTDFYSELKDVLEWAADHVTSVLCSCLSTHAVMRALFNETRSPLKEKLFGVYRHHIVDQTHPLTRGINTAFDAPHARNNKIDRAQFEKHDMRILAESPKAGVHLASSKDGLKLICFQGHPEYDRISLLKEYKRDIGFYFDGKIHSTPPLPHGYFQDDKMDIISAHIKRVYQNKDFTLFDEDFLGQYVDNTWQDTGRSIIQNWVGAVYQVTGFERNKPFMDDIDPNDPIKDVLI